MLAWAILPEPWKGERMRLIDADELKIDYGFTWDDITPTHEEMYALIDRQPTIDAVPVRHGRWIKMSDADGQYYCCSECGEELYRKWTFDREFDIFPKKKSIEKTMYCSNCGAKMDGDV